MSLTRATAIVLTFIYDVAYPRWSSMTTYTPDLEWYVLIVENQIWSSSSTDLTVDPCNTPCVKTSILSLFLALTLYDCSNFTTNQTSTLQDSQVQTSCYQAEVDYELHYLPVVKLSHHLIAETDKGFNLPFQHFPNSSAVGICRACWCGNRMNSTKLNELAGCACLCMDGTETDPHCTHPPGWLAPIRG
jgi:hypothetical protein